MLAGWDPNHCLDHGKASPGHTVCRSDRPVGGDDGSSTAMGASKLQADLPWPGPWRGQVAPGGPARVHPSPTV